MLSPNERDQLTQNSLLLHGFCINIARRDAEGFRRSSGDVAVALSTLNSVRELLLRLRDQEG